MRTEKFYRAAQKGLKVMNSGSFYSPCDEVASDYVGTGDELYTFDLSVKLFDLTDYMTICDFDLGLSEVFDILEENDVCINEVFNQNDGVRIDCGNTWLVILFGRLEVGTNNLTKLSFEEMLKEDNLFPIVK